jgi:hypothetical protein
VADLIDFAEDRAGPDDRRRIETHLHRTNCPHCRSWIARATADPATPEPPFRESAAPRASRPTEETAWRKEAFLDLEKRLRSLDEE